MMRQETLSGLYREFREGRLSRRAFIERAAALGAAMPVVLLALQTGRGATRVAAQDVVTARPAVGTEAQQRGAGGELKLLQYQATTLLAVHSSTGTKDTLAASLVTEPLMSYLPDASLIPTLVDEVPTVENGLLASDRTSVTYRLRPGIVWSDGTPLTARDVAFTWRWIADPVNAATSFEIYAPIADVTAVDDQTVKVSFKAVNPAWYIPFTGAYTGGIYPEHVLSGGAAAYEAFRKAPIGTGPYVVEEFRENDLVTYVANEQYREPNKPYFARVNLKGGGEAEAAASGVLQTGDWDFAWNVQVEPDILAGMEEGGKGVVVSAPGSNVEFVFLNFADPNQVVNEERAERNTPHPFLSDKAVRQAMALGADRQLITERLYGEGAFPAGNILTGIPAYESPNTTWSFDVEAGKQALEAAGWTMSGDVREKNGVRLEVRYASANNPIRQKTQEINKSNWEAMGIKTELVQIPASVFFDSAVGNDQNYNHFYYDLQMDTNGPSTPYPTSFMAIWYGGPDGRNIAQKANDWTGLNKSRYANAEYDALYEQALVEPDPERAAEILIQMNDILINDVVIIPLVQRPAEKYAIASSLRNDNVAPSSWEPLYWNIANWNRTDG